MVESHFCLEGQAEQLLQVLYSSQSWQQVLSLLFRTRASTTFASRMPVCFRRFPLVRAASGSPST